jgi:hypothetical protein
MNVRHYELNKNGSEKKKQFTVPQFKIVLYYQGITKAGQPKYIYA